MKQSSTKNKFSLNVFSMQIVYLCIVIIFAVIMSIVQPSSIYIDLFVIFFTATCSIYVCFKEIQNKKYRIAELTTSVDIVLKENLNLLEIPMAMVSNNTDIVWQNNICKHLIPQDYIVDMAIELEKKKINADIVKTKLKFGDGNTYIVVGTHINFSNFKCLLITFIDNTKEEELEQLIDKKQVAVGIIFVDNFEETMQGLDDIVKSDITSKIDKELRKWVQENSGIISKIDKDKYAIFIEKQYVDKMEKSTFVILEKIRSITDVTKLPLTISIGMSYSDESLSTRYLASNSALDIALGRGGDQVVIKNDKNYIFYGGTNLGVEKTSRVRARTIAQALKDVMEKSDSVYIVGHKNTDIDCIGSAVGIYKIAKSLNKPASIIIDAKYNNSTRYLVDKLKTQKEYEDIFIGKDEAKKIDTENSLLVVVDTHKKSYLACDILEEFNKVVVIDHHRRGPEFIENTLLTYHELYSSSTSELVSELLMYLNNISLTPIEAEALYAGILVDTKNFTFKTGVKTFEVAAYLKKSGLDISEVKQIFKNDFETYISKVEIVKNAEIIDNKIAISVTEDEHENMPIIAAQAADELLSITGISASFVLCKVDNVIMISGRSMGDINVQAILENMGGGGHLTFAGAQLAGVSLDEAKQILISSINNYFGKVKE
ncbi:MAG: DHH family phosphoesterase [Clostridia bacterium]|nr:DHH family phosphoesterase [Clostridia bacterium]